jgi:putative peptide zinc metalloprotease protein
MAVQAADLKPIDANILSIEQHIAYLESQQQALTVRARQGGTWVAPNIEDYHGSRMVRGTTLGSVLDEESHYFYAIVPQQQAKRVFVRLQREGGGEVRLFGQSAHELEVSRYVVVPAEQTRLRSAGLGWLAGGEVQVDTSDPSGLKTAEPFYEVRAYLAKQDTVPLLQGRSGRVRFELDPEPLLIQWGRKFRQLLQRRYQI